jgi:hypothetical protein
MVQKNVFMLATVIVVGVISSYGIVVQNWVEWSTTTLVDLDKRSAIMEVEVRRTNEMVLQNYEMLKDLTDRTRKTSHGDYQEPTGQTDVYWTEK